MNSESENLSKKERKELKKELEKQKVEKKKNMNQMIKWGVIAVVLIGVGFGGWLFIQESSKPLPGKTMKDLGRGHVPVGTRVEYNSNPPTSGQHYAEWTRAGVYDAPLDDRNLVHSLEHGYIIVSYNCEKKMSFVPQAFAQEMESSPSAVSSESAVPMDDKIWKSKDCEELQKKLEDVAKKERLWKFIVIPRPLSDARIALTAWTRIDKMETVDESRIHQFTNAFRDKGPEKTIE